jgi:hypothetical protein
LKSIELPPFVRLPARDQTLMMPRSLSRAGPGVSGYRANRRRAAAGIIYDSVVCGDDMGMKAIGASYGDDEAIGSL